MSLRNYLLIIDKDPAKKDFEDYFAQYAIDILLQQDLYPIDQDKGLPLALLIHWNLVKDDLRTLTQIHQSYPIPILVINDLLDDEACVLALESGADDFLYKPLSPKDTHARITAIARRIAQVAHKPSADKNSLHFANWRMHTASRRLFDENNNEVLLSAGEFDLLLLFAQQPQSVLDRDYLLQSTKQSDLNPFDRRIDVQISRLRQKIEPDAKNPTLIKTIRNGGYMFTPQVTKLQTEIEECV